MATEKGKPIMSRNPKFRLITKGQQEWYVLYDPKGEWDRKTLNGRMPFKHWIPCPVCGLVLYDDKGEMGLRIAMSEHEAKTGHVVVAVYYDVGRIKA